MIKATPTTCDPTQVDHSVLLVGFGKTKSGEGRQGKAASFGSYARPRRSMAYWTLKNSWGPQWGEEVSVIYGGGQGRTDLSPLSGADGPSLLRAISGCIEGVTPAASPSSRSPPEWRSLRSSTKSPALPEAAWLPFGSLLLCPLPSPATRPKAFA